MDVDGWVSDKTNNNGFWEWDDDRGGIKNNKNQVQDGGITNFLRNNNK